MHSAWLRSTFLRLLKLLQIKDRVSNFWWEPILQKVWIIWYLLLYFNFKSFMVPNSSSFIRFQCIPHDSGVLFSESWNIYKLNRGALISGGNQFCRKFELFGPPLLYFYFKSFIDPKFIVIHYISMHSSWLRSSFLRFFKFLQIKVGGPNFWGEPTLQKVWIIWSRLLYFNLKSFMEQNHSSFLRFQCILDDSGAIFSD